MRPFPRSNTDTSLRKTPLTQLVDLVERDFIEYWYSTSVALTPGTPFPQYTRSLMNEFLTTLVALIRRQDAKVTALSLAQAASRLLCTEIAHKRTGPPLHIDRAQQTEDFRRCSQQVGVTSSYPSCRSDILLAARNRDCTCISWTISISTHTSDRSARNAGRPAAFSHLARTDFIDGATSDGEEL